MLVLKFRYWHVCKSIARALAHYRQSSVVSSSPWADCYRGGRDTQSWDAPSWGAKQYISDSNAVPNVSNSVWKTDLYAEQTGWEISEGDFRAGVNRRFVLCVFLHVFWEDCIRVSPQMVLFSYLSTKHGDIVLFLPHSAMFSLRRSDVRRKVWPDLLLQK